MCTSAVRIETQGVKGPAFVSAIRDELKQFRTSATRKKGAIDLVLDSTVSIPREGYTLVVTPDRITVTASALPGTFLWETVVVAIDSVQSRHYPRMQD